MAMYPKPPAPKKRVTGMASVLPKMSRAMREPKPLSPKDFAKGMGRKTLPLKRVGPGKPKLPARPMPKQMGIAKLPARPMPKKGSDQTERAHSAQKKKQEELSYKSSLYNESAAWKKARVSSKTDSGKERTKTRGRQQERRSFMEKTEPISKTIKRQKERAKNR